jgi:hypothetical protein
MRKGVCGTFQAAQESHFVNPGSAAAGTAASITVKTAGQDRIIPPSHVGRQFPQHDVVIKATGRRDIARCY